jgi:hypothetical protein
LLLQPPDCPLRDTVTLWLTHEGGRDLGPEEFGLVLEAIGKVVGTVFAAKDQTGSDALSRDTQIYELTRHPVLRGPCKRKLPPAGALTPRSQSAPAKGSGMPGVVVSF